ncbi:MAG: zinc-binding alcohol dehydrogenase family protein [Halorientalis sp.]
MDQPRLIISHDWWNATDARTTAGRERREHELGRNGGEGVVHGNTFPTPAEIHLQPMKAVRYHEYGGPEVLQVDTVDRPTAGRGELLVEVRAASVNPVDFLYREGVLGSDEEGAFGGSSLPSVVGTDLAGVVAAVGPDVTGYEEGDRVFGTGMADAPGATVAEYAVAPADHLARLPEGPSFEEAAAAAHVGGTAWRAIVEFGDANPGDWVLIHGGSGGVGHVAVQLAALSGARVVATASSERARERVLELGATEVLDYGRSDLAEAILDAAGGPVDLVLDPHTEEYLNLDVEVTANGGTITHINGRFPAIANANPTRTKELTMQGVAMHNTPNVDEVMAKLGSLLADGDLQINVDRTYAFEEARAAHEAFAKDQIVGKIVLTPE